MKTQLIQKLVGEIFQKTNTTVQCRPNLQQKCYGITCRSKNRMTSGRMSRFRILLDHCDYMSDLDMSVFLNNLNSERIEIPQNIGINVTNESCDTLKQLRLITRLQDPDYIEMDLKLDPDLSPGEAMIRIPSYIRIHHLGIEDSRERSSCLREKCVVLSLKLSVSEETWNVSPFFLDVTKVHSESFLELLVSSQ
ncbi:hypothetical protein WA026_001601 [Henosepilachna vigintioctopunctata]|uniref:Uncharacterized protein n=1 Tax=Henosepilachna vigintioctopunctata TaxID=420089 RepID=A0AAW1UTW1_9CUCU